MIDRRMQGGLPDTRKSRHQPRYCEAREISGRCDRPTNDYKPFCQLHIDQNPYVTNLLREIENDNTV